MAGEWLKMECATPDKPEVFAITAAMGWDDPDLTVGKLFRVWRWFDQQTTDGNARGVTAALLDRIAGATGFAKAMLDVGWLTITETGVELPNFDKHNGATAKSRAQTAKRVANHRSNADGNDNCNGQSVTGALAREEKKRKERKEEVPSSLPEDQVAFEFPLNDGSAYQLSNDQVTEFVELYPAVNVDAELRACLGWNRSNPKKRKTRTGILKHINGWLAGKQDSPANGARASPSSRPPKFDPVAHVNRNRI